MSDSESSEHCSDAGSIYSIEAYEAGKDDRRAIATARGTFARRVAGAMVRVHREGPSAIEVAGGFLQLEVPHEAD